MENTEKIGRLKKEIEVLKQKKAEKDELKQLFAKRNRLKLPLLYKAGGMIKNLGKRMGDGMKNLAENESKRLEEERKQQKQAQNTEKTDEIKPETPKKEKFDVYEAMFGKNKEDEELNKALGIDNII